MSGQRRDVRDRRDERDNSLDSHTAMKNATTALFHLSLLLFTFSASAANTVNDYIKTGLVGHWDGEYNQGFDAAHSSVAGCEWKDLSGQNQHATAVAQSGVYPYWGANYMNPSNMSGNVSSITTYYTYTPGEALQNAVDGKADGLTWQYCGKAFYVYGDTSFCGFKTIPMGVRPDYRGSTSPLFIRVHGSGESSAGSASYWLKGVVDSFSWGRSSIMDVIQASDAAGENYYRITFTPGTSATSSSGARLGPGEYGNNGDYALYAVRFYNRRLSRVELLYNSSIDRVRFLGETARTQKYVATESSLYTNYGTSSPAYDTVQKVNAGAAQTFSISGLTTHEFDQQLVRVVSGVERAVYLGATLSRVADNGTENSTEYDETHTTIADVTIDTDAWVTWNWRREFGLKASASTGGKIYINGVEATKYQAYTNWYDAAASESVTVTAVANDGWAFNGWTGDIAGSADQAEQTMTMSQGREIACAFVRSGKGDGSTRTWKGGASTTDWFNADNWVDGLAPLEDDHAVISPSSSLEVTLASSTPRYASVTIGGGTGTVTLKMQNWATALNADVITVGAKGVVRPASGFTAVEGVESNRVYITCRDFTLEAGGKLYADELGYSGYTSGSYGYGPGAGQTDRGGAGHGSRGGHGYQFPSASCGKEYGSVEAPEEPGSSSGGNSQSSAGGGAIRIAATGRVNLYGTITANGGVGNGSKGSGSGGSVYITSETFFATNLIQAKGGYANGASSGGGGGGRIAIHYDTAAQAAAGLVPTPILRTGSRYFGQSPLPEQDIYPKCFTYWNCRAECGTIYLSDGSFLTTNVLFQTCGNLTAPGWSNTLAFDYLALPSEATAKTAMDGGNVILVDKTIAVAGDLTLPKYSHLTLSNCTVTVGGSVVVNSGYLDIRGATRLTVAGDLTLKGTGAMQVWSNAAVVPDYGFANCGALVEVTGDIALEDTAVLYPRSWGKTGVSPVFKCRNLSIASGAKVNGYMRGWGGHDEGEGSYIAGYGPGWGQSIGASYGGMGGGKSNNTKTYGDEKNPTQPGSDCYRSWGSYVGGWGGGLFYCTVENRILLDGTIAVNGSAPRAAEEGGGSGGGVNLRCKHFSGAGSITANGGDGSTNTGYSGNGGGGRVAVTAHTTNLWTGTVSVLPGQATYTYSYAATAGTVYYKLTGGMMILLR